MDYYIEEQTSFKKENGKYGFNYLIRFEDYPSLETRKAYFFDVYASDETFNRYKQLKDQLNSAGYICKFIEKKNRREPQLYRTNDDPMGVYL